MEQEKEGSSVLEIWLVIWRKKIWLLLGTFLISILSSIVLVCYYNPRAEKYYANFDFYNPNLENFVGTVFNYKQIISEANISAVINSDEKYKSIDFKKIINNSDLRIVINSDSNYTLSISKKYIENFELAKSFIYDLIDFTSSGITNNFGDFDYLDKLDYETEYRVKLYYLTKQQDSLINVYNQLIILNNDIYINGKKISNYLSDLYDSIKQLDFLKIELYENGFIKNIDTYLEQLELESKKLRQELEDNKLVLKYYEDIYNGMGTNVTSEYLDTAISSIILRNVGIERELIQIESLVDNCGIATNEKAQEFETKINEMRLELENKTEIYKKLLLEIYKNKTNFYFEGNYIITVSGGFNTAIIVAGTLFLGLIISSGIILTVNILIQNKKDKKKRKVLPIN